MENNSENKISKIDILIIIITSLIALILSFITNIIFQNVNFSQKTLIKYFIISAIFIVSSIISIVILTKNKKMNYVLDIKLVKSNVVIGIFMGLFYTLSFILIPYLITKSSFFGSGLNITFIELLAIILLYISMSFIISFLYIEGLENILISICPKLKYIIPLLVAILITLIIYCIYSKFDISLILYFVIALILSYQNVLFEKQNGITYFSSILFFDLALFIFRLVFLK